VTSVEGDLSLAQRGMHDGISNRLVGQRSRASTTRPPRTISRRGRSLGGS
jgi:hypothetical protein